MLPKQYRLTKDTDIKRVFQKSKRISSKNFTVLVHFKENRQESPRFGFITTSKLSKKAVERNRVRRRTREIIHKFLEEKESGLLGKDIVFLFKSLLKDEKGKEISNDELVKEVEGILLQAKNI